MASNYRSSEAAAWRSLYKTRRWKAIREHQKNSQPLCEWCLAKKPKPISREATVIHHAVPHKGDVEMFFDPENLVSLCKPCHDVAAHRLEARGYSDAIDATGWPTCLFHPANRVK